MAVFDFFKKLPKSYYFGFFVFVAAAAFLSNLSGRILAPVKYDSSRFEEEIEPPVEHIRTPQVVRGIYMTSWVAGTKDWRAELVDFIDKSELNSVVIDVKDYTGRVSFEVADEKLKSLEYSEKRIPDIKEFIGELHQKNIYAVARISVFQDPHLAKKRPDLAVKRKSGALWKDRKGLSWVDPGASEVWDITVRIGREAEKAGFDELNFDYIRFPSDGDMKDIIFPISKNRNKVEVMSEFFAYLDRELENLKVPISADIFGMTTVNPDDLNIGQHFESLAPYFDYLSPMVYPSHYPPGFQNLENPAAKPYEVINFSMSRAVERLLKATSTPSKLRPWLQDFDLGAAYDARMVRLEKQAVYDAGLSSWLSWDPSNKYTREAYEMEAE